uniref:Protein JTB n=1 Tax=Globodera pallida TaxID=36090 RepID=A0A183BW16_GLOPA
MENFGKKSVQGLAALETEPLHILLASALFVPFGRRRRRTARKAFCRATMALWEWFNRRRLAILVGLLITCSLFILLFEEYVEDSLVQADKFLRRQPSNPPPYPICPSSSDGAGGGNKSATIFATLSQHCQRCNDFELNALQTDHCRPTGYFDVYTCPSAEYKVDNATKSHHTIIYKPCLSMSRERESVSFYMFTAAAIVSTLLSALLVRWRRELLERRAFGSSSHSYARLLLPNGTGGD